MTRFAIPDAPRSGRRRAHGHGLRFLDLKMTFARNYDGVRLEKAIVARYVDWLFPNLVLSERETAWLATKQMPGMFTWEAVEEEIRLLRQHQRPVTC